MWEFTYIVIRTSTITLTHWGRVTHICVGKLTIIGSDNGLSPGRRQIIIGTNAGMLLIRTLETNFSEILIEINTFSLKKIRLKMSSAKFCSFHLCLNVLNVNNSRIAWIIHGWSTGMHTWQKNISKEQHFKTNTYEIFKLLQQETIYLHSHCQNPGNNKEAMRHSYKQTNTEEYVTEAAVFQLEPHQNYRYVFIKCVI